MKSKTTPVLSALVVVTNDEYDYPVMVYMADSGEIKCIGSVIVLDKKREAKIEAEAIRAFKKFYNIKTK